MIDGVSDVLLAIHRHVQSQGETVINMLMDMCIGNIRLPGGSMRTTVQRAFVASHIMERLAEEFPDACGTMPSLLCEYLQQQELEQHLPCLDEQEREQQPIHDIDMENRASGPPAVVIHNLIRCLCKSAAHSPSLHNTLCILAQKLLFNESAGALVGNEARCPSLLNAQTLGILLTGYLVITGSAYADVAPLMGWLVRTASNCDLFVSVLLSPRNAFVCSHDSCCSLWISCPLRVPCYFRHRPCSNWFTSCSSCSTLSRRRSAD